MLRVYNQQHYPRTGAAMPCGKPLDILLLPELAVVARFGDNDTTGLAQLRLLAKNPRAESKAELAKLALGLRTSGLISERVTRPNLIDQQGEAVWSRLRARA